MVKTGARAEAFASVLSAAGYRVPDVKVPSPRLHDLNDDLAAAIRDQFSALGGNHNVDAPLRPGSWDLAFDGGLLIELDEELHFNRYRSETLRASWALDLPWTTAYLDYCATREHTCLAAAKWGKRWTNPSCERLFGAAGEPGAFDGGGAPRWKQRALYDAIKDAFAKSQSDYRLARVSVYDLVDGLPLEQVLRAPSGEHVIGVTELVTSRTL